MFCSVGEAAEMLKVSEADIRSCIQSGKLRCAKLGANYTIPKVELDAFLSRELTNFSIGIDNTDESTVTSQHSDRKVVIEVKGITGSVSELRSGKNRFMATVKYGKKDNGRPLTVSHRCNTREEANSWIARTVAEHCESLVLENDDAEKQIEVKLSGNMEVSAYVAYFLKLNPTNAKPRTVEGYFEVAGRITRPKTQGGLGDFRLKELNERCIVKFFEGMLDEYQQPTINKIFTVLRTALRYAYKKKYISENVMDGIKKPKSRKPSKKVEAYTEQEEKLILEKAKQYPEVYPILLTLSMTGVRPQELMAMKWENVDFDKKLIKITNAVTYTGSDFEIGKKCKDRKAVIGSTKSESGVRALPLADELIETLKSWRDYIIENDEFVYARDEEYIFTTRTGGFMNYSAMRSKFTRFLRSEGLEGMGFTFYRFRHAFCTKLMNNKVNLALVKEMMGDSSTDVIIKHYTTVTDEAKRDALNSIL